MDISPSQSPPQKPAALAKQLAKASWLCAVAIYILTALGSRTSAQLIVERVALLLMVVGLLLGLFALFGIRKHGTTDILTPALVGIATNVVLLIIFATNFFAARATARANMIAAEQLLPTVPESSHGSTYSSYKSENISFDYDSGYDLRENKETGQIFLRSSASAVIVSCFAEPVDMVETLKDMTSAMQQALRKQSNTGFTLSDVENINGAIRSGSLMRMEYDKPELGRFHADTYLLSARTNCLSVVHIYSDRTKANSESLFTPLLRSLKD